MQFSKITRTLVTGTAIAGLAFGAVACGDNGDNGDTTDTGTEVESPAPVETTS